MMRFTGALLLASLAFAQAPRAVRFSQNPLITQQMSARLGDNINGPSLIRVPAWVEHPLGRYYLYFAHHKGSFIRMAYANELAGPWKLYEPGVMEVKDTEFYRPQPDNPALTETFYTHVASPEVVVDEATHRFVMLVHGWYTAGKKWPGDLREAARWSRENGYAQFSQSTVSADGLHFTARPGIAARTSYARVFQWKSAWYSMGRLGVLGRAEQVQGPFESGPNPFAEGTYAGKVRHVATLLRGSTLYVFFTGIGDAPERILLSTIALSGDWRTWRASPPVEVLRPEASYECTGLPLAPSKAGDAEGPENAVRDPGLIEDNGRVVMFYSYCGEQGLAAADVTAFIRE